MYSKTETGKASKGTVGVSADKGTLRLSFPRLMFGGKQKFVALGLRDTPENRVIAEKKALQANLDISNNEFDFTLEKYKPVHHLTVASPPATKMLSIVELWDKFTEYKKKSLKPKTLEKYDNLRKLLIKVSAPLDDAIAVKGQLEKLTTIFRVKDALMYLSAASNWGCKNRLLSSNPYEGMSNELPKHNYQDNSCPNAFTDDETALIIQSFKNDERSGMNYKRYAAFVEFLFLTGCRPSEAVGLQWKNISEDCGTVHFMGSIGQVGNRRVRVSKSKNNRTRSLAVSPRCQALLKSIQPPVKEPEKLLFSVNGQPINYRNFSRRAWSSIVDPIKPDTTPYNARDTFITNQLMKGVPSAIIAKWCDTSVSMIDKSYADKLKLSALRPLD